MFVLKSTLARVEVERNEAKALAARRRITALSIIDENHRERTRMIGTIEGLRDEVAALKAELAKTYVRDAKGRIARHPSAAK